jgi:hypothetical protein
MVVVGQLFIVALFSVVVVLEGGNDPEGLPLGCLAILQIALLDCGIFFCER